MYKSIKLNSYVDAKDGKSFNAKSYIMGKSVIGLQSFNHERCLVKQVNTITLFYFINIIVDLILFFLGNDAILEKDIICANENYFIVQKEIGGIFMFFYTIYIMVYSGVMWYVFYQLPVQHNLVSFSRMGMKSINIEQNVNPSADGLNKSMANMLD